MGTSSLRIALTAILLTISVVATNAQSKKEDNSGVFDIKKLDASLGDLSPETHSRVHNMMVVVLKAPSNMSTAVLNRADSIFKSYTNVAVFYYIDEKVSAPFENFAFQGEFIANKERDPNMPWGFMLDPKNIEIIEKGNLEIHKTKK